jgi:hypothetical protein
MQQDNEPTPDDERTKARRAFLPKCGRFVAVTGPAVVLMMTVRDKAGATAAESVAVLATSNQQAQQAAF